MNSHVEDLLWSLVQNFAWTVVVVVAGYVFYRAQATRKAARSWGLPALVPFLGIRTRDTPTLVVATSDVTEGRPMTGIGQVRAIALLTPSIVRAYGAHVRDDDVRMSRGCRLDDRRFGHDLVTIGGGKTNEVTADVLGRLRLPDGYGLVAGPDPSNDATVERILWAGEDGRRLLPDAREGRKYALGLVIRCANPYGTGVLTVIAGAKASGSGTYGTEAAAAALAEDEQLRRSRWRALRGRRFGFVALVSAEIIGSGEVARLLNANVLDVVELPWDQGGPA